MTLSSSYNISFLLALIILIDATGFHCIFWYTDALSIQSPVKPIHRICPQLHIPLTFPTEQNSKTGIKAKHARSKIGVPHVKYSSYLQSAITSQSEDIPLESKLTTTTSVSEEGAKDKKAPLGSYRSIITFVSTTVIIWLSEPILSLVDTTVLGRFASTSSSAVIQLAALGPATMLIDSAIYLTYFLAIATTNQLAKAIAEKDVRAQHKTTSHALGVAVSMGLLITAVVLSFGVTILKWIIGDGGGSATAARDSALMLHEAVQYSRIRCITAPLSVMGLIAQSAALASLDTWTPLLAVIVASFTNIIGDLVLCVHPFQMGIKGAAIATAAASTIGSTTLLLATKRRMNRLIKKDLWENTSDSSNDCTLPKKNERIPFLSFPDKKSMWNLVKLAGPIFFVITGKLVCYSAMTVKATSFGVLPLACHNVMLRIFFFFTTFGDSFSQSAQTMLPQALYSQINNDSTEKSTVELLNSNNSTVSLATTSLNNEVEDTMKKKNVLSKVMENLRMFKPDKSSSVNRSPFLSIFNRHFVLCIFTGIASLLLSTNILTTKSSLFTSDVAISQLMSRYAPWISFSLLVHPIIMLFEGSIIASRDLGYLVGCYGFTIITLLMQLNRFCDNFTGIWKSLFLLQFSRLLFFGVRVFRKMIFNKKEGKSIAL